MTMDTDSRKKLKRFWQKRLLFGLGTVGFLGLGVGTIGLMRSTYDELQIIEGRDVPERFYQEQIAQAQTLIDRQPKLLQTTRPEYEIVQVRGLFSSYTKPVSPCVSIKVLGQLKDPNAIPLLGKLLQDSQTRAQSCDGNFLANDAIHMDAAHALGQFQRDDALAYLKTALITVPKPAISALWKQNSSHIAITQKLAVLRELGQLSQYDEDWRNKVIQILPELNQYRSRGANTPNGIVSEDARIVLSKLLHNRKNSPQLNKALIALFQDEAVEDCVLEQIAQILSSEPQYLSLVDILYIKSAKANRTSLLSYFGYVNTDIDNTVDRTVDPQVSDSLFDLVQDKKVPDQKVWTLFYRYFVLKQYGKLAKPLSDAARVAGKLALARDIHREYGNYQNVINSNRKRENSAQNTYPLLDVFTRAGSELNSTGSSNDNSSFPTISSEIKAAITKLQELNTSRATQDTWLKAGNAAIPALKSALQYPVLRTAEDIQRSEVGGYLTEYWSIPCAAAVGLIDLNNTDGIQPCIVSLKNVAATQYATEEQRQPIYKGYGGGNYQMIEGEEDKEYRFSALDVAVFHWSHMPKWVEDRQILNRLLVVLLKDSNVEIRRAAMFSLSRSSSMTDEQISSVFSALKDSDAIVREYAVRYHRGRINSDESVAKNGVGYSWPAQAVMVLNQAVQDTDPRVRQAAKSVLSNVSHDSNQSFLLNSLYDRMPQIRANSVNSLCRFGEMMLPALVQSNQQESNANVRMAVMNCLKSWVKDREVNDQQIAPALILSLNRIPLLEPKKYANPILETLEILVDRGQLNLDKTQARQAIPTLLKINQDWRGDWNIDRIKAIRLLKVMYEKVPVNKTKEESTYLFLNLQGGLLAGISVSTLILLLSSLRLRNPFPLIWTGYLIFPEEIVAELMALKQRRQAEKVAPQRIRFELAYEVLLLFWAVHVQIRLDNLHLPPGGNDRAK
jgi:hypothetical protein